MADERDIRIIEQLNRDGRLSLRKIAEKLDYSPSTVSNHFRQMKEDGVIQGFRPSLDYSKLGFDFTCISQINTEAGKQKQTADILSDKRYIHSLYQVTGETDIIAVCKFRSREQMRRHLLEDLNQLDGVTNTKTNVALKARVEARPLDLSEL